MSKIITNNQDGISNIEKITKYCSILRQEFKYPYYFEWNFPTNHVDNKKDGELQDSEYFFFNVGRYPHLPYGVGRSSPVSKQVIFGPIWTIMNNGRWVSCLLDKMDINYSLSQICTNQDEIKNAIDDYLHNELIDSANRTIKQYNKEYTNQEPVQIYNYGDNTVLKTIEDIPASVDINLIKEIVNKIKE